MKPTPRHLPHDWFPAPLPDNVVIGEGSWLYSSFAFVHCHSRQPLAVRIGHSSGVYNGSFFELGPDAEVRIGNYCTLVGVTIASNSGISMGDYCFLAHEVVIADGPFATPGRAAGTAGAQAATPGRLRQNPAVVLGDDVWVGAGAILLGGARIGSGAVVGAAAVVDGEVPEYGIVAGNPGRVVGFAPPGGSHGRR